MTDLGSLLSVPPWVRLLFFFVLIPVAGWARRQLSDQAPRCLEWVRGKGHNGVARILQPVFDGLELLLMFGWAFVVVGTVFSVLQVATAPLLQVVEYYRCKMLDLVMILMTASSILLVFASTIEDRLRRVSLDLDPEDPEKKRKLKAIQRARVFGLLCVGLSVAALFAAALWSPNENWMLAYAALALGIQVLLVFYGGLTE